MACGVGGDVGLLVSGIVSSSRLWGHSGASGHYSPATWRETAPFRSRWASGAGPAQQTCGDPPNSTSVVARGGTNARWSAPHVRSARRAASERFWHGPSHWTKRGSEQEECAGMAAGAMSTPTDEHAGPNIFQRFLWKASAETFMLLERHALVCAGPLGGLTRSLHSEGQACPYRSHS
jgi:hypothetical protein